jgi:hypothetical protein
VLKSYLIYTNCCDLFFEDGTSQRIYYSEDSGKLLCLIKTHPLTKNKVDHHGVIIGKLYDETIMVLHNQLTLNQAEIITSRNFSREINIEDTITETRYDIYTFLQEALKEAVAHQPYAPLSPAKKTIQPGSQRDCS